jgi:hypothetical protein
MNRMRTAKEALIAEALGDLNLLLKRLEAVVPLVDGTRKTLIKSTEMVSREIAGFAPQMKEFTDYAKIQTAKQIDRTVMEVTQRAKEMQVQAMREAALDMFKKEFHPTVNQVIARLEHLARLAQPRPNPWMPCLTHGASFMTGAALTWLVMVVIWAR